MKRTPVTSSNVASIGYDSNSKTMEVEFTSGSVYRYFDVPEGEYQGLVGAESIGRYLNQSIKGTYRFDRVAH
jgi:hypothetical protein